MAIALSVTEMSQIEEWPISSQFDCREPVQPLFCEKCDFSSHVSLSLFRHTQAGCGNKVDNSNFLLDAYKCKNCEFVSCSRILASSHEAKCRIPNASCTNNTSLWICSHCDFTISYKSVNLDNNLFECESCNYRHTSLEELKEHAIFVHLPNECLKFLFSNDGVKSKIILQFACEQCKQQFDSQEDLCKHRTEKHTGIQVLLCDQINDHIFYVYSPTENTKWFECEECGYKSKRKCDLRRHEVVKHASIQNIQLLECQECGYKCRTTNCLNQHKVCKHTPAKSIQWFECEDKCGYKTKRKNDLRRHKFLKHTSIENCELFKCQECGFKTKMKCNLKKHKISQHS